MYSSLQNIQILISLLKQYNVRHIVISAGTRHTPFVYSVEQDSFFQTYSIVDERSASFFALGLIEELHEPVAICCTSGTAAANYASAVNEAFYQQLPLLVLTADRNHYYMFQQEEQMIPQEHLYSDVCKKTVTLNHVRDKKDYWYCSRICNEALLELREGELGPVHINFIVENNYPMPGAIVKFGQKELPVVKKIRRLTMEDPLSEWKKWANRLKKSKILIIYGQYRPLNEQEIETINRFCLKYNCVFSIDLLSNLTCKCSIPTFVLARGLNDAELDELAPDIIITMNANSISEIKGRIGMKHRFTEHWHVSAKGQVSDPFRCLPDIVACSPMTFFEKFSKLVKEGGENSYYELWLTKYKRFGDKGNMNNVEIPYSSLYGIQQYLKAIPSGSLLHIANSNSIRLANYFSIQDNISVYDNRGAHGIDGSMSSFIGQAFISKRLSFLVIGDLSFFYDMNALWNQYVSNNVRILVCNNSGGAIFHNFPNIKNVPTLDLHIAAEHKTSVKDWVVSRGFIYLSAHNKEEFDRTFPLLMKQGSSKPILMEIFTEKEKDIAAMNSILTPYIRKPKQSIKQRALSLVPKRWKESAKEMIYRYKGHLV